MRVISLFAGVGGFDLGFERAGFEIVAHVEIDPQCRRLLQSKWPDAVCLNDVREAGRHNLPDADVIAGGFPCQDLSVAGRRAGMRGERSGLFYEMVRIIDEIQPLYVATENVPGLLSSEHGKDFHRVLRALTDIGYHGAWRVLDSQYFGVAQRRRRWFGVFSRGDTGAERCAEILSVRESMHGDTSPRGTAGKGAPAPAESGARGGCRAIDVRNFREQPGEVSGTLQAKESGSYSLNYTNPAVIPEVAGCLQERDAKGPDLDTKPGHLIPEAFTIQQNDGGEHKRKDRISQPVTTSADRSRAAPVVAFSSKNSGGDAGETSPTLRAMAHDKSHMNGGGQVAVACAGFKAGNSAAARSIGYEEGVSPTLSSAPSGTNLAPSVVLWHNHQQSGEARVQAGETSPTVSRHWGTGGNNVPLLNVRRLTPRETERLQGFPDDWTAEFSDSVRYRMMGNAVTVNVAEWIARRMKSIHQQTGAK